nr:hypothetical protein [Butyricimonas sp. Marseille-P3923]
MRGSPKGSPAIHSPVASYRLQVAFAFGKLQVVGGRGYGRVCFHGCLFILDSISFILLIFNFQLLIGSDVSSLFPPGGVGLEDEGLVFTDLYGEVEFLSYVAGEPYTHCPEIGAEVDGGDERQAVTGEVDGGGAVVGEPQGSEVCLHLAAGDARPHGVRSFARLVVVTRERVVAPRGASRETVAEGYALDAHDGRAVAAGNGGQHPVRPLDGEVQPGVGVHQPHPEAGDAVAGHGERGVPVVEPPRPTQRWCGMSSPPWREALSRGRGCR